MTDPAVTPLRETVPIDDLADLVLRHLGLETSISRLRAESDEIKAAIQHRMGQAEIGTVQGRSLVRWTHHTRRAVDVRRLRDEHPDLYSQYLTSTPYRRFEINEEH